ncbi:MAG: DNA mismatch repair endonuclease MutL [Spirochaetes bacterium]|nr:DNA mismatch repair endonuclease MutL [Spirochaetota bacterium]
MNRIIRLPESVKNKIAAGEVIEGPFSIIKELVENSIDAKATEIDVEVFESGSKKIVVRDNGTGIYKDDLPLTIEKHATSKIKEIEDIEKITSFGFRGEALSSIASVSVMTILSRSVEENTGCRLVRENEKTEISDYAGENGTTIIVENLFYNIPARKKFMKTKTGELRKIREIFLKIAIPNPDVSFSFSSDGKRVITLTSVETVKERLEQIYGKSTVENLYFDTIADKVEISGFLSKPGFMKASRTMQMMYVNNRLIDYNYLGFFLSKAYQAIAPKGNYPAAILFIKINPDMIDVNIHPAKKEIKFFDQNYINGLIIRIGEKVLSKTHSLNLPGISVPGQMNSGINTNRSENENNLRENPAEPVQPVFRDYLRTVNKTADFSFPDKNSPSYSQGGEIKSLISETRKLYKAIDDDYDFVYLGIVFDTYILIEKDNTLRFIDFHAAHERFIYDTLEKSAELETQNLIFPQVIELSIDDYQIFLEKKEYFSDNAFDIDIFSDNSIVVRGIPGIIKDLDIEGFFFDIIESFRKNTDHINNVNIAIAEKLACHSAKRSGDLLTDEDAKMIAARALEEGHDLRCPHGRPFVYELEKKELEKAFKRI